MKKTIQVTATKTVTVCDICGVEIPENEYVDEGNSALVIHVEGDYPIDDSYHHALISGEYCDECKEKIVRALTKYIAHLIPVTDPSSNKILGFSVNTTNNNTKEMSKND